MSNLVLYRKYRPKTFAEVINQDHVKTTLAHAVINNRVGHAYLFVGPRGVGKTTLARVFARSVNCLSVSAGEPCNSCNICMSFLSGNSLDLLEIDAASHTGVDNIRELIDHLQFSPAQATYKVIIVDEVHMLSKGAFNALLKTLEEPPKHAIFILATTEVHKVPATIISRCQRFDFKRIALADLIKLLKLVAVDSQLSISEEALSEIGRAADGSFRDALSLLDQVINYSEGQISADLVEEILGLTSVKTLAGFLDLILAQKTLEAVNFISSLMYQGGDLFQFQKDFLEYLRKVLLVRLGASSDFGFDSEVQKKLDSQASGVALEQLIKIIELFMKAGSELKWAAIQSLPLELAAVEATQVENNPSQPPLILRGGEKQEQEVPPLNIRGDSLPHQLPRAGEGELLQKVTEDTLDHIKTHWPQILEKIKDYNHSLISSMKLADVAALEGKDLILVFPYKFHKDTIEARKNRIVVDQAIEEVTGIKLMVKPVLKKDWESQGDKENLVESALKIMGGEVE